VPLKVLPLGAGIIEVKYNPPGCLPVAPMAGTFAAYVRRKTESDRLLGLTEIDLLLPSMENVIAQRVSLALSKTEPTEFRRRFAHNLRQVREAAGLPQRVLARVADLPLSRVWRIEVNAPNVTLDTITQLAKHLGCTEIDLLRPKDP